jgi:hypothetical protein
MPKHDIDLDSVTIGQDVSWWTGRGSSGRGKVTKIEGDRVFVEPASDSIKGSDYRLKDDGSIFWPPISTGISFDRINTPPNPWFKNS